VRLLWNVRRGWSYGEMLEVQGSLLLRQELPEEALG